jgi:hypothetical protein
MRRTTGLFLALTIGGAVTVAGQSRPPAGLDSLLRAVQADSNEWTAHYDLAMGYWDRKQWDDAERAL